MSNVIYGVNGPVVTVKEATEFSMMEMVYVGKERLVGEVIGITSAYTTIQCYEETTGLMPGDPVEGTHTRMNLLLGPGILDNIFDGIERPLAQIEKECGAFINRGSTVSPLDTEKEWDVTITVKVGDRLVGGMIYATTPETHIITHKMMVPPALSGKVVEVKPDGKYKLLDTIVKIEDSFGELHELTLCQRWPIRTPRPVKERLTPTVPLITGQRVIDTLFPVSKGGTAAIPGGFGTGKTMTQHQLAKWCDADIIVYVGCGERGNEMSQVLQEFSELIDPKSGHPMTDRTTLIANTSNMPVAAREASIYTGITLAEYYRDMGYDVAIMADSTSRWAEALREISGRLRADVLSGTQGSVTIIGAVSPQGSDFSEPVTQNTKRFTRCFWALDKSLAYARHYPAINWNDSYSEYFTDLDSWYEENCGKEFIEYRGRISALLQEENRLMEIVKLIGSDVLPDDQKLIIEIAKIIRVGFLQQNAFHKDDTYVPLEKQKRMMQVILHLYDRAKLVVAENIPINRIREQGLFEKVTKIKYDIPNDHLEMFDDYIKDIDDKIQAILH